MAWGKIHHIDLTVDDVEKAEKYFIEKLGFKLRRHTKHGKGSGKAVEITSPAGDFFLDLHQMAPERKKIFEQAEKEGRFPIYFGHVAFEVDDIQKEYEELKEKKVTWLRAPNLEPTTGRTLVGVADADGRRWLQLSSKVEKKVG